MLQIKTIRRADPCEFDEAVNAALLEGWQLTRRFIGPDSFIAEMEQVIITEAEKCCDNCKYCDCSADAPPCRGCEDASHWEALEG